MSWTHEEIADVARKAAAVAAHLPNAESLSDEECMRRIATTNDEHLEVAVELSRLPYFQRVFRKALARSVEEQRARTEEVMKRLVRYLPKEAKHE